MPPMSSFGSPSNGQEEHVGVVRSDRHTVDLGKCRCEGGGGGVVVGEAFDVVLHCVDACGSDHTDLAKPTAEHLSPLPGLGDQVGRAGQDGTHRRPEPLRQAQADGVEVLCQFGTVDTKRHGGVPHASAVEVGSKAVIAGDRRGFAHALDGQHLPVLGVFDAEDPAAGEVRVVGFDRARDLGGVGQAVLKHRDRLRLDAAEHGGPTRLPAVAVGHVAGNVFVASTAMGEKADQIRLGATCDKHRRILPESLRHHRLEAVDGRIVIEDVVADGGINHRLLHGSGWTGDGVRAEIDHKRRLRRVDLGIRSPQREIGLRPGGRRGGPRAGRSNATLASGE